MYAAAAGRGAVVPPRPGRAVGDRQDLLGRDVREPDAREPPRRCATPATPRRSRAWTPTGRCRRSSPRRRPHRRRSTAPTYVDQKMDALRAHRHPDHRRRAVLRAVQQRRQPGVGRRVLPDRQGHAGRARARTGSRPTCSPAFDRGLRSARSPTRQALGLLAFCTWCARPGETTSPAPRDEGGRVVLALILGLALLAGGAYTAAPTLTASDKVPVGTRVAGVDIGGQGSVIRGRRAPRRLWRTAQASRSRSPSTATLSRWHRRRRARRRLRRLGPQGRRRAQLASLAGVGLLHLRRQPHRPWCARPDPAGRAAGASRPQRRTAARRRVGGVRAPRRSRPTARGPASPSTRRRPAPRSGPPTSATTPRSTSR